MLILNYSSKVILRENIGKVLSYTETSMFGEEFPENGTGKIVGCNRP